MTERYKRYALAVVTLVYTLNYLDRGLIVLLLQPIKVDLHLTDTELGFLTGIAFALFYATLGLPIARWADRGNRVTITSIAIGLWSVTVMSCVFVTNFAQLVMARVAAAVGESGCMPPTYSLVGDYFPAPAARARAMSVYWLGNPFAAITSFIVGGWLNELYGWRVTFLIMGIPGLVAALLAKLTLVEPRKAQLNTSVPGQPQPRMASVFLTLWHQRSSRHLILAMILLWTLGAGLGPWEAAFMIRSHGLGTAELGIWMGIIFGSCGIAGILAGGYVASRWFSEDERGQMRLSAITIAALVPCLVLFLTLPGKYLPLLALIPLTIVFNFFLGPTFALLQRLVADEIRATTLAVVMLLANLIGMGIGPQIVGILSDTLQPSLGNESLRYALFSMCLVSLLAAHQFWCVGRTVRDDLAQMNGHSGPASGGFREYLSESAS